MKTTCICVLYQTPQSEVERLKQEGNSLDLDMVFVDNTTTKQGYSAGINKGLKQILKDKSMKHIFLANSDISFTSLDKTKILQVTKQYDIAGYGMRQHGTIYYGGELDRWRMSGGLITVNPKERFVSCDFVSGSLMVINRKVIESIGFFDESYGMYYEEVDYCIRARMAGFTVGVDSDLVYDHFENSVTSKEKDNYLARNRWKILWKYGSWQQKAYEIIRLPKTVFEQLK